LIGARRGIAARDETEDPASSALAEI